MVGDHHHRGAANGNRDRALRLGQRGDEKRERRQHERRGQVAAPRRARGGGRELEVGHAGEAHGVAPRTSTLGQLHEERQRQRQEAEQPERIGQAHLSLRPSWRSQSPSVDTTTCSMRSRRSSRSTRARSSASSSAKRSRTRRREVST